MFKVSYKNISGLSAMQKVMVNTMQEYQLVHY